MRILSSYISAIYNWWLGHTRMPHTPFLSIYVNPLAACIIFWRLIGNCIGLRLCETSQRTAVLWGISFTFGLSHFGIMFGDHLNIGEDILAIFAINPLFSVHRGWLLYLITMFCHFKVTKLCLDWILSLLCQNASGSLELFFRGLQMLFLPSSLSSSKNFLWRQSEFLIRLLPTRTGLKLACFSISPVFLRASS